MMLNRYLFGMAMVLLCTASYGESLFDGASDWLMNDLSVVQTDSGTFNTSSGMNFSGPSTRARIRTQRISPISITPMSFNAGCNGIDINFGGISFITGEEILDMLRTIAQGTGTVAFNIAVTQGCPICMDAINWSQKLSNMAREFSYDSCKVSTAAAEYLTSGLWDSKTGACASKSSNTASDGSFLASISSQNGSCNTQADAQDVMKELVMDCDDTSLNSEERAACNTENLSLIKLAGVSTYEYLKGMGKVNPASTKDKVLVDLYISLAGTYVNGAYVGPSLTAKDYFNLVLCGVQQAPSDVSNSEFINGMCSHWWEMVPEQLVRTCFPGQRPSSEASECAYLLDDTLAGYYETYIEFNELKDTAITKYGSLYTVSKAIKMISDSASEEGEELSSDVYSVVQAAGFPLYKLINLEKFRPGIVDKLLGTSVEWLAMSLSQGMIDSFMNQMESMGDVMNLATSSDTPNVMPESISKSLREATSKLKLDTSRTIEEQVTVNVENERLTNQITQLEKALLHSKLQGLARRIAQ